LDQDVDDEGAAGLPLAVEAVAAVHEEGLGAEAIADGPACTTALALDAHDPRTLRRRMSVTQYYTATSLDGYIADEDHSLEWIFTQEQDRAGPLNYADFVSRVGAVAMGSTTYEWIREH